MTTEKNPKDINTTSNNQAENTASSSNTSEQRRAERKAVILELKEVVLDFVFQSKKEEWSLGEGQRKSKPIKDKYLPILGEDNFNRYSYYFNSLAEEEWLKHQKKKAREKIISEVSSSNSEEIKKSAKELEELSEKLKREKARVEAEAKEAEQVSAEIEKARSFINTKKRIN